MTKDLLKENMIQMAEEILIDKFLTVYDDIPGGLFYLAAFEFMANDGKRSLICIENLSRKLSVFHALSYGFDNNKSDLGQEAWDRLNPILVFCPEEADKIFKKSKTMRELRENMMVRVIRCGGKRGKIKLVKDQGDRPDIPWVV